MEFVGHINGITKRNKTNVTYQSMIDGELVYEYQIHHMYKKTASFRCAGCRSAISDGRAPDFKPEYLSGKVDFVAKTVRFKRDPDEEPHCCERRHPHWVKGKQLRFNVRNDKKETGATGTECIQALNKEVKDKEEDGDHDGVMFHIGKTETLKRQFKRFTKDTFIDYYRKQWRDKLKYINYYDTIGPRTTNGNECYQNASSTYSSRTLSKSILSTICSTTNSSTTSTSTC